MARLSLFVPALLYVALLVVGARWEPRLAMLDLDTNAVIIYGNTEYRGVWTVICDRPHQTATTLTTWTETCRAGAVR
jgi:hypothetical protein